MTSEVSWLPVNAAWVYGRGCFCVVLHNTEISTQHGTWGRNGDMIERGRSKIQILFDSIFPRGHESHLQGAGGRGAMTNSILFISDNYCAFQKKTRRSAGAFQKRKGKEGRKRIIIISFHFGSLIFFWVGAVVRKLSFSPDLKRKAISKWQMQTSTATVCSALGKLEVNFQLLTGKRLVSKIPLSLNIILQKYLLGCKRRTLC